MLFFSAIQNFYNQFELIPVLSEFALILFCFIYILYCIIISQNRYNQNFSLIFSFFNFFKPYVFFYIFLNFFITFINFTQIQSITFFNGYIIHDFATIIFKNLFMVFCLFIFFQFFIFTKKFFNFWRNFKIYPLLLIGSIFFLYILISTYNIFFTGLCIFGMSLCFYGILLGNFSIGHVAREPIIKYFLFSAVSSGFFFGGCKEFFFICETFKFNELNDTIIFIIIDNIENIINLVSLKYGLVLILFGFFFKLSAAPSYFWAPDVYEGSSFNTISFLIIPTKFSISLILIKLLKFVFIIPISLKSLNYIFLADIDIILLIFLLISIIFGGINAITEQRLKRFLAYSSINQIGFSLLIFLGYNNSLFSIQIYIYFILVYMLNILGFIFIVGTFIYKFNFLLNIKTIWLKNFNLNFLSDLKTLFWFIKDFKKFFPILSKISFFFWLLLILVIFSFAGIPPLFGFYGKFYVLFYIFILKYFNIFFIILIMSIISTYYYLRLLKNVFFSNNNNNNKLGFHKLIIKNNFYYLFWYCLELDIVVKYKNFLKFFNFNSFFLNYLFISPIFFDSFFFRFLSFPVNSIILC